MKIGVIDIGSNSVRLMMWADGKTLYKKIITTRLGEGLNFKPCLIPQAISRTADAVESLRCAAREDGAEKVYAFATAAVRSAQNGGEFTDAVLKKSGIRVDVVGGEEEAAMGLVGALCDGDGGIIDVGGASTEVTVRQGGKIIYSRSVNVGTVRIHDAAGRDLKKIKAFVAEAVAQYGEADFSSSAMYAVGGTASRLGAISRGIKIYEAQKIDGARLTASDIHGFAEKLTSMSVEEIRSSTICGASADIIGGGAELMAQVMDVFRISHVTVSERDNLEGYVALKLNGGADV